MFHLGRRCELICEPAIGLQSKATEQKLLPHVGGSPVWYAIKEGTQEGSLLAEGCSLTILDLKNV
jgi:hypothetical protein